MFNVTAPALLLSERTIGIMLAGVILLLILGVVFPAVWSKDTTRRRDARAVLNTIFKRR